MSTTSYKIASDLFLVWETAPVAKTPAAPKPKPTNHVVVIDVSGSMSYELPKLRTQLKDKLVHLLRDDDTVSIIWFSGRGEFGVLTEAARPKQTVAPVKDVYIGRELAVEIDGYKSLPALTDVRERLAKLAAGGTKTKPLTGGAALMASTLDEAKGWSLATLQAALAATARAIKQHLHEKSQMIVAVIVGQTWFKEFKSLDENTYTLTTSSGPVTVTFTQREVEIEI